MIVAIGIQGRMRPRAGGKTFGNRRDRTRLTQAGKPPRPLAGAVRPINRRVPGYKK